MKTSLKHTGFVLLLVLALCMEHAVGLPFFSFTLAVFLFASLPGGWRNLALVIGGGVLATIYILPFWLGLSLFFCLRLPIEFFPLHRRYEDLAVVISVLGAVAVVGWWIHYPLSSANVVLLLLNSLLFGVIMVYFVRQHQPQHRL